MRIVGKVEIADELLASNGFADLRSGTYGEHLVAIKTLRITARDDYVKIRKVTLNVGHPGHTSQSFHSSDFVRKSSYGARYPIRTS